MASSDSLSPHRVHFSPSTKDLEAMDSTASDDVPEPLPEPSPSPVITRGSPILHKKLIDQDNNVTPPHHDHSKDDDPHEHHHQHHHHHHHHHHKRRIVVIGVDGSEHSNYAVEYYFANVYRDGDYIVFANSFEISSNQQSYVLSADTYNAAMKSANSQTRSIERMMMAVLDRNNAPGRFVTRSQKPGEAVCHVATDARADLVVTGCRGLGKLSRLMLGSVSSYVMHHAHCPVLVCRPKDHPPASQSPAAKRTQAHKETHKDTPKDGHTDGHKDAHKDTPKNINKDGVHKDGHKDGHKFGLIFSSPGRRSRTNSQSDSIASVEHTD